MGRIDRLIVSNFKSYEGEQVIGPFKTFTCIIGPNGSGKSNLMDAISFVLGVQAGALRGTRLAELVHSKESETPGEEKRSAFVEIVYMDDEEKLQGAIAIEGSDEREMRFRRTIQADGSAFYSINGRRATAKRYAAVLKTIGVLVKARNFLVFQREVSKIPDQSPAELTQLFETVSGSGELRERWNEARDAYREAEDNLMRTYEKKKHIDKERKQVQEQKEEAERFQELRKRYSDLKAIFFLWQLFHADRDLKENEEKSDTAKTDLTSLKDEWTALKSRFDATSKSLAKLRRRQIKLDKATTSKRRALEKRGSSRIKLETQIKGLKAGIAKLEAAVKNKTAEASSNDQKVTALKEQLTDVREEIKDFENKENEDANILVEKGHMTRYNELKQRVGAETAAVQQDLGEARRLRERKSQKLQRIDGEVKVLQERKVASEKYIAQMREKKTRSEAKKADLETKLTELDSEYDGQTQRSHDAVREREKIKQKLQECESKLEVAASAQRQSRRQTKYLELVETLKRIFPNKVRGRLYELIDPTRREYKLAVTIALGKNMDAIVVDSEQTAIACIDHMKNNRLGKATFIPLDTIRVKPIAENLRRLKGSFKLVYDVFRRDESVDKALLYACGNTLLCDSEKEARDLCYAGGRNTGKYKVVTKNGTIFHKSGNMSGGFSEKDSRRVKRWDDREVASAQQKAQTLRSKLQSLERNERREGESQETRRNIASKKNQLQFLIQEMKFTEEKLDEKERELASVEAELKSKRAEAQKLKAEVAGHERTLEGLQKRVTKKEASIFRDFSREVGVDNIAEYEKERLRAASERADRKSKLTTAESRILGELEYERTRGSKQALDRIRGELADTRSRLAKLEKDLATFEEKTQELKDEVATEIRELADVRTEMKTVDAQKASDRKEALEAKKQLAKLEKEIVAIEAETEKLNALREQVIQQAAMEQVEIPRVPEEAKGGGRSSRRTRGATAEPGDYDFDRLEAEDRDLDGPEAYENAKQAFLEKIAETESAMQKINPNLKAFEQYEQVQERLRGTNEDFKSKKDDRKSLDKEYEAVTKERTDIFMKVFENVRANIDRIYKALTKSKKHPMGGNAELNLESTDEPFLHGIKYTAMPPGKRFRDIDKLSGGEKTVAALALLFAIHNSNPAPFFVLDEIDAALDGVNVNKVSNYIQSRTRDDGLQCIVISLKDTFYHKADALVGVYRDKDGETSGSLTLDLRQYDTAAASGKALSHSAVFGSQADEESAAAGIQTPVRARVSRTPARSGGSPGGSRGTKRSRRRE